MATFVMEIFHCKEGSSDKLWAVCVDGTRVITHWGPAGTTPLRGGGPITNTKRVAPQALMDSLIDEKIAKGYRQIGTHVVADGVLDTSTPIGAFQNDAAERLLPDAYAELPLVGSWRESVRKVADRLDLEVQDTDAEAVTISVGDGPPITMTGGSKATIASMTSNGPMGRLLLLALGQEFRESVYDSGGAVRGGEWINQDPEGFDQGSAHGDRIRTLAERAGLVLTRLRVKSGSRGAGLFA